MTKKLTEQWKNGELASGWYFYKTKLGGIVIGFQFYGLKYPYNACHQTIDNAKEVLAPVPSYRALYGPNDGNMPTGVFTVLKIIKENIDITQKQRRLTDLECGIKSQVVSLLKRHDCDLGKDGPVSNTDEFKDQYITNPGDCQQIVEDNLNKKCSQLEKKLEIATKALKDCYNDMKYWAVLTHRNQRILSVIKKALEEMEGVK